MDNQNEQQMDILTHLLDTLRQQLLEASTHFDIWEVLWPTEDVVLVINRYRGFFQPTRPAHLDRFFIKICNIVSFRRNQPSFYNVFSILNKNEGLAPSLDVKSLKKQLKSHNKTIAAIREYRNSRAAHWEMYPDKDITPQPKPVLIGDSKRMLKEMQDIFNEINRALTKGHVWSFKLLEHADTSSLLARLKNNLQKPSKQH